MDSAENLIAELERLGITVWAEADRLRYKAPQGGLTPGLKQRLTDNKGRLLALLSRADGAWRGARLPPIKKRAGPQPSQLSYSQQQLWVLAQMLADSPAYNDQPFAYHLRGMLDVEALGQALCEIVRRHGSLRTVFVNAEGQPLQVLSEPGAWTLPVVDLLGEADAHQRLEQLLLEEAIRGFDLARGPLFRAQLYRLDADTHVLQLTRHHIISDGWSTQLLLRELGTLYEAFSAGRPSPLAELPIQYADFAEWQRDWLQGEVLEKQLGYWKEQLKGAPALLELPSERLRPASQSYRGARETAVFPLSLLRRLEALSREEGASLFMTLLAAFQTLLCRYSGQEDIAVGSPIAGRNRVEVEGLIGFFINMLVLRSDLSGNPTFRELLGRVKEVALEAYAHQDLPFERLVEELHPERNLSYSPLFQVLFTVQDTPSEPARLGALEMRSEFIHTGTSKFDLSVEMAAGPDGLEAAVEYSTDLFGRKMICRLLDHFRVLLEGIVAAPEQRIMTLPLLSEAERHQVLDEWNTTETDYPADALIHELFEAQAARTPEVVAVEYEGLRLTYGELNARANQLAHYLARHGVGKDVMVGICVERSLEMVVGILGILKAGGAYVPLDPEYPASRLSFMLEDTAAPVLLTQATLRDRLPAYAGRTVSLDTDWPHIAREGQEDLGVEVSARNLAYVIYTSGSTGKPKGVVVPHRAVVNFLTSMMREPSLTADDVLVAVTTLSFDIAVLELHLPLMLGAMVVIATRDETMDGYALKALLEQQRATVMQATPFTWRLLLEAGWSGGPPFKALVGGEALPKDLADQLIARGVELWNLYGPTETTVWSTCARITDTSNGISIGKPIANTTVYILDAQSNLCPIGVPGELCIGGVGVTLGYWNRPELTAERFIPDPFSATPGATLYRSGDRARWCNDGTLEHLGRLDDQAKMRGFRIELGEIEAVLAEHPEVRQAVVLAREDVPGDTRLVAYLVADHPPADLVGKLRALLRASLPEYMVPAAFVLLEALPLTPNGKIDRKALPLPDRSGSTQAAYVAPHTPTEEILAGTWGELLRVEPVGIEDNFFDLGGHSLLAVQVVSRVRQALGVELQLRDLFAAPTVSRLAACIEALQAELSPMLAIDALALLASSGRPTGATGNREEIQL
jgi:amino acid adenylation domain-containing protein